MFPSHIWEIHFHLFVSRGHGGHIPRNQGNWIDLPKKSYKTLLYFVLQKATEFLAGDWERASDCFMPSGLVLQKAP